MSGPLPCRPLLVCSEGAVSSALLAVLLDPFGTFDTTELIHIWTRRYAAATGSFSMLLVICYAWLYAACPAAHGRIFRAAMAGIIAVSYVASQGILFHITILRLQVVAPGPASARASRLLEAGLMTGGISVLVWVIFKGACLDTLWWYGLQWMETLSGFIAAGFLAITMVIYIALQSQAMFIFGSVAMEARAEARADVSNLRTSTIATQALWTVVLQVASAGTTVLFVATLAVYFGTRWPYIEWVFEFSSTLDVPFDALLALLCAGLVVPEGDRMVRSYFGSSSSAR